MPHEESMSMGTPDEESMSMGTPDEESVHGHAGRLPRRPCCAPVTLSRTDAHRPRR